MGMDIELMLLRGMEEAEEIHRFLDERGIARDIEPAAIDRETVDQALALAPAAPGKARAFLLLGLEEGAEDAGEVPHILGHQEVMLHEALDAAGAGVIGIAHLAAHFALAVEGQAILGAFAQEMEMAAHGPEEVLRARETRSFFRREDFALDETRHIIDAIDIFGDPEEGMEIPERALALLDIGLHQIA